MQELRATYQKQAADGSGTLSVVLHEDTGDQIKEWQVKLMATSSEAEAREEIEKIAAGRPYKWTVKER